MKDRDKVIWGQGGNMCPDGGPVCSKAQRRARAQGGSGRRGWPQKWEGKQIRGDLGNRDSDGAADTPVQTHG